MGKTLLAVLAHPDDETFGMGGTLALYAQRGVDVHLVCATRGEVGEMDPKFMRGFTTVAERREAELRCAAEHLGLKAVHFLNYRDSGMTGSVENGHPQALMNQPVEQVALDVARYIREIQPQVVITFDSIGGYRHPDHIAMHHATLRAVRVAADPAQQIDSLPAHMTQKIYLHVIPNGMLRLMVRLMPLFGKDPRKFGKNQDIDLLSITEVRFPVHARIQYRSVAKIRDEATACHASQGGGLVSGPFAVLRRLFASNETFMRAYPEAETGARVENDLFAGVTG